MLSDYYLSNIHRYSLRNTDKLLGTVTMGITGYLKTISPNINFDVIQRTILIGTLYILRNFLAP